MKSLVLIKNSDTGAGHNHPRVRKCRSYSVTQLELCVFTKSSIYFTEFLKKQWVNLSWKVTVSFRYTIMLGSSLAPSRKDYFNNNDLFVLFEDVELALKNTHMCCCFYLKIRLKFVTTLWDISLFDWSVKEDKILFLAFPRGFPGVTKTYKATLWLLLFYSQIYMHR